MESPLFSLIAITFITYVPAYVANMMPPVAKVLRLPGGHAISEVKLGKSKTYRGIYAGAIGGALGALLLYWLGWGWYAEQPVVAAVSAGTVMGFGALLGDAAKSYAKRRRGIPSGQPFVPFDQLDFILGGTLLALLVMPISLAVFITALIITPALHLVVNIGAYTIGLKDVWW